MTVRRCSGRDARPNTPSCVPPVNDVRQFCRLSHTGSLQLGSRNGFHSKPQKLVQKPQTYKNSVELRGFEPLTPSIRTERTIRRNARHMRFLHVREVKPGTVTPSDRA
jgi:hypothetical protein